MTGAPKKLIAIDTKIYASPVFLFLVSHSRAVSSAAEIDLGDVFARARAVKVKFIERLISERERDGLDRDDIYLTPNWVHNRPRIFSFRNGRVECQVALREVKRVGLNHARE